MRQNAGLTTFPDGNLYIQDWNHWGRITKLVKTAVKK